VKQKVFLSQVVGRIADVDKNIAYAEERLANLKDFRQRLADAVNVYFHENKLEYLKPYAVGGSGRIVTIGFDGALMIEKRKEVSAIDKSAMVEIENYGDTESDAT